MDPNIITSLDWIEYRDLISYLWLFPILMFVVSTSILLSFGIIPSLVESKEIPEKAQRIRPLLYLTAAGALAGFVVVLFVARDLARVIENTYLSWWI
jgi:hypothetical protein